MVPSAARPDLSLLRAAFALSPTATRASPLRVRGGITRDGALSTCRCAELVGEIGFLVAGGGEGPCTRPRARYPLSPRGVVAGRVGLEGRRWAPGPTRLRFPRALRRVCVPPTRVHVPATLAARSCRVWCVPRALGRLRLPPRPPLPRQRSHGRWSSREPSYPPLPPPRGSRGSVNRGVGLALGGGLLIWGNRRSAASGASSDVGTRCHAGVFVGWRRRLPRFSLASAGVSSGSRGVVRWFRVGSVPRAWRDCSGLGAV